MWYFLLSNSDPRFWAICFEEHYKDDISNNINYPQKRCNFKKVVFLFWKSVYLDSAIHKC